ncbi:MAG: hypothetical protein ACRC10_06555 [Thermoguttaceae bacterium]
MEEHEGGRSGANREEGSLEFLWEQLAEIRGALFGFDTDLATDALERLLAVQFTREIDEQLKKLKVLIEDFDYEGAIEVLDSVGKSQV